MGLVINLFKTHKRIDISKVSTFFIRRKKQANIKYNRLLLENILNEIYNLSNLFFLVFRFLCSHLCITSIFLGLLPRLLWIIRFIVDDGIFKIMKEFLTSSIHVCDTNKISKEHRLFYVFESFFFDSKLNMTNGEKCFYNYFI